MKKLLLLLLVFSLPIVLFGCSPSISLDIEPDPVVFTEDNRTEDIEISIAGSGFGEVSIDSIDATVIDEEGESIFTEEVEIGESAFIISGITVTEEFTLDLEEIFEDEIDNGFEDFYDKIEGQEYTLKIKVSGSETTSAETDILFE